MLPWWERKAEEGAAFVLKHEKWMGFVTGVMRVAQRAFVRKGVLNLPDWLNPAAGRQLPHLAKRSFRQMWQSGELEQKQ